MNPPSPSNSCNTCGASKRRSLILHSLRQRAINRRFCTNCLLKNHPGHFCPICFHVYEDSPPPHLRLVCLRCPAIVHRSCATDADDSAAPQSFQCPVCADPNFSYFKPRFDGGGAGSSERESIDADSAKVLVAAARIAAQSMSKAAAAARLEAERCAKEAAAARKKAREALERLARIVSLEEKDRLVEQEKQEHSKRLRMMLTMHWPPFD